MGQQIQLRRGTSAETAAFTGAVGEVTVDTTDDRIVVHDGVTAGGIPMAKESEASGGGYTPGGTDVALADGGTGASLSDPGADRIFFWDDSAGVVTWLQPSAPIVISSTSIDISTATTTTDGSVELATDAETITGTDNQRAMTPSNLTGASIYGNLPQNSKSADYTLVAADQSKHIFHPSADTTARVFTIPANGSVAYPIGTTLTFINQNAAGVVTIAITTDTMRLAGAGTTGSRTLAANGVATAVKVTSTEWIISGTGLT